MAAVLELLWDSPKPVVCRVNGPARRNRPGGCGRRRDRHGARHVRVLRGADRRGSRRDLGSVPAPDAVQGGGRVLPDRRGVRRPTRGGDRPADQGRLSRRSGRRDRAVRADAASRRPTGARRDERSAQGWSGRRLRRRPDQDGRAVGHVLRLGRSPRGHGRVRGQTRPGLGTEMTDAGPVLRVANCSGFYGDRVSAAREVVEGGPIDVLTGDWLAELTMLLLGKAVLRGRPGYARTFLTQMEQVLPACLERGIKIVSNAGGLDPAGCAAAVTELARRAGLSPVVAYVDGDDLLARVPDLTQAGHPLTNTDTGETLAEAGVTPLTAHAYLGGLPIARALAAGADVVVTGRVTDAALVVGPGMWRFGWTGDDLDALAGAVVTGHILECGCQATGGNYSFLSEVPDLAHAGFPLAELAADGSAVITKHPGTGGLVSVGTVTAQLLYEIDSPRYLNPDVTARFDTIALAQAGADRVRVSGVRGEPPPADLKVALNYAGGYRNSMILAIEGLDVVAKAALAQEAIWARA